LLTACLAFRISLALVATDPLPRHADAGVVLNGSMIGQRTRLAGAMTLLQQQKLDQLLVSIPDFSNWDQPVAPVARQYLERKYGNEAAVRVDFCETGPEVNSTEQEAKVLLACIRTHHWNSVAIVTSDYHTRRAGIIWRRLVRKEDPQLHIAMIAVNDPEFGSGHWWQQRLFAKTSLLESTKLVYVLLGGR
jgi:uncharacterized SAM-binding protein YcdF (DUF218 family)